jgi:hypothetical protein
MVTIILIDVVIIIQYKIHGFISILKCSWNGDHAQDDLSKFGYIPYLNPKKNLTISLAPY